MSEDDNTVENSVPRLNPGGLRWLEQIVGKPRASKVSETLKLPPGLDGRMPSEDRFDDSDSEDATTSNEPDDVMPEIDTVPSDMPDSIEQPSTMVVIDLDVSVGIDDPEVLDKITVSFSGLPEGASLSTGHPDEEGVWKINATELEDLSIIITEDTGDFELLIVMDSGDGNPQSANIHVANDPTEVSDKSVFNVLLARGAEGTSVRFYVYLDGQIAYDRVITWAEPLVNLHIPMMSEGLPFEIVMRFDVMNGDKSDGPTLVGINIDGSKISSGSPAITTQGQVNDHGISWQGDLIVDVRNALRGSATETEIESIPPETEDHAPSAPNVPVDIADTPSIEPDAALQQSDEPDDTPNTDEPVTIEEPEEFPDDVLIVDASLKDLRSKAFIEELRGLRDFIRGRASDKDQEVYHRLGIDVTKWRDMHVRGPMGAPVDLDPLLPSLAPRGGLDNTRRIRNLRLPPYHSVNDLEISISGLEPGMLLTHGTNTGNGHWLLSVADAEKVSVLPAITQNHSTSLMVSWSVRTLGTEHIVQQSSVLCSTRLPRPKSSNTEMRTMSLPLHANVFDPEGHGALSLTVGDMPPGTLLSKGKNHGGGVWTIEAVTGSNIELVAVASMKPFNVTLTCVALNSQTGDSTVNSHTVMVSPAKGLMSPQETKAA